MTLAARTATLTGQHVALVPLDVRCAADLADAAAVDRSTYRFTAVPDGEAQAKEYITGMLAERDAGRTVPLAHRELSSGRFVGCTRFMELRWFRGRDDPDEVEIGGTWLGAAVQRSAVNTESKLLMLTHAFETWGVWRVALCTDERNDRSRAAIERLGATFEGILAHHRQSYVPEETGRPRNTAMFGITDRDWPTIKDRLVRRLTERA